MKLIKTVWLAGMMVMFFLPSVSKADTFFQGLRKSFSTSAIQTFGLSGETATQLKAENGGTTLAPETVVFNIITVLLGFLGVVFFVLMIYGGSLWMDARGNEETTTKAKKIITDAVIGLLVIASAYMITYYVGAYVFENTGIVENGSISAPLND